MASTYSHNFIMYDSKTWKTIRLFQVLGTHMKVSGYGMRQGASSPTLYFETPF